MKTLPNRIGGFLLPLFLLLTLPALVQAQFTFTIYNGTVTITGYTGTNTTLIIPSTTNGLPVVRIGNYAFANVYGNYSQLISVTIPNSITNIGDYAFDHCYGLSNVVIGTNIVSIGNSAFYDCSSLNSIIIPDSVTSLGSYAFEFCGRMTNITVGFGVTNIGSAFANCAGLTAITVDTNNPAYSSFGGVLFDKAQTTLIQCPMSKAGKFAISATVTAIAGSAFYDCYRLVNVVITNGVTSIGSNAFSACSSLTNFTIPASVTNIGIQAFGNCNRMTAISVATNNLFYSSVSGVLFDKDQTTIIQYPGGLSGSYVIPTGVVNIGDSAFGDTSYLSGITIPDGVTNIGNYAFVFCIGLRSLAISGSVSTIGNSAFFNTGLTNVTIPDGTRCIGDYAFYDCYALSGVAISGSVTNIGTSAFSDCYSMTAISVAVTNLFYCTVDGVLFDKNLTTLLTFPCSKSGNYYKVPDTVTSIGPEAFHGCPNLISVTLPAGVADIGTDFYNCTSLTGFYFMGNAPAANFLFFFGNPKVTVYYLPGTTGWQAFAAFVASGEMSTALWLPQAQASDGSFGMQNNQFGFNITWASGQTVVVEACTNLSNPVWQPVQTNTLTTGSAYFSDPQWTNYPSRFYRLRSPQ